MCYHFGASQANDKLKSSWARLIACYRRYSRLILAYHHLVMSGIAAHVRPLDSCPQLAHPSLTGHRRPAEKFLLDRERWDDRGPPLQYATQVEPATALELTLFTASQRLAFCRNMPGADSPARIHGQSVNPTILLSRHITSQNLAGCPDRLGTQIRPFPPPTRPGQAVAASSSKTCTLPACSQALPRPRDESTTYNAMYMICLRRVGAFQLQG